MFRLFPPRDEQLVQRALRGRRDAFELLVHRHLPSVRAVAYARTGNFADAEDAAQETFLRALQGLDGLREASRFGAWLLGIARNVSNQLRTARAKEFAAINAAPVEPAQQPDIERNELRAIVRKRLEELDEPHREIILLHYFAGNKIKDVAALLEISQEAARKRLQRARETLGALLLDDLQADAGQAAPFRRDGSGIVYALTALPFPWGATTPAAATTTTLVGVLMSTKTIVTATAAALIVLGSVTALLYRSGSEPSKLPVEKPAKDLVADAAASRTNSAAERAPTTKQPSAPSLTGAVTLSGVVCDINGAPVQGATITCTDTTTTSNEQDAAKSARKTTSGESGEFEFDRLVPSSVVLRAEKQGMLQAATRLERGVVLQGYTYTLPEGGLSNVVLCLWRAGAIRGVVTDAQGHALEGQDVTSTLTDFPVPSIDSNNRVAPVPRPKSSRTTVQYSGAKSGPGGLFEFANLCPGTYTLSIASQEEVQVRFIQHQTDEIRDAEVTLADGQTIERLHLVLPGNLLAISGRVTDRKGNPIKDTVVFGLDHSVKAPDGIFRFTRVPQGAYDIRAEHAGYKAETVKDVAAGSQDVSIVLTETSGISGRVIEAATGKPVQEFKIRAFRGNFEGEVEQPSTLPLSGSTLVKDAQGKFNLAEVPDGDVTLVVRAAGFAPALRAARKDTASGADGITIKLSRGAIIEGRALKATGEPVSGATVILGYPPAESAGFTDNNAEQTRSGADGLFRFDTLSPGPTVLSAFTREDGVGSVTVVATETAPVNATIVLGGKCAVSGKITEAGKPLEHIEVVATGKATFATAFTGPDGAFSLTQLAPVEVTVRAELPGGRRRQFRTSPLIENQSATVNFDLGPRLGAVEGQVSLSGAAAQLARIACSIDCADGGVERAQSRSDTEGRYRVEGLPAGRVFLSVQASTPTGNRSKTVAFDSDGNHVAHVDIEFPGAKAVLTGHVTGARHNELGSIALYEGERAFTDFSASLDAPNPFLCGSSALGADASFRFDGIEPGVYTVVVIASRGRGPAPPNPSEIRHAVTIAKVTDDAEANVEIVLP